MRESPKQIPHSRPTLGDDDTIRVSQVIQSGHIAQGPVTQEFERAFSRKVGVPYAISTSSGTAALHLTLLAMGVQEGDEVILPSYVCTALLNAVHYVGAVPVLADISLKTFNLDPDDVKKRLTPRTRAVIIPHMFGLSASLRSFLDIGVPIIEDCAQALGTKSCMGEVGTLGHAAIFSFYATKVMTTGEGGMVVSNSNQFIERARDLREYDNKPIYKVRYNYKMTDLQAALGLGQLKNLAGFIRRRRAIAKRYYEGFSGLKFQVPPQAEGHIYYRFVVLVEDDAGPWITALREKGVHCARPVYMPLHRYLGLEGYPNTEKIWKQALSIPIYPSLSDEDVTYVIQSVIEVFSP